MLLEDLPRLWEEANVAERRKLLLAMLDGVYVDTVEEKAVVAMTPKPSLHAPVPAGHHQGGVRGGPPP